jgi:penicillin-binding protein 2
MIDPVHDRRAPISPQLAMRVAFLGVLAFILFGVIFFRLWYLQVLSGDQYLRQAQVNKVRVERIPAPRGAIKDRDGHVLVENKLSTVITIDPRSIPDAEKKLAADWGHKVAARAKRPKGHRGEPIPVPAIPTHALAKRFRKLGRVIGMRGRSIQERVITGLWLTPYAPVKVKTAVDDSVRDYLLERADEFPGVDPQQTYLRSYPHKQLAAQIFGTIGEIEPAEIKSGEFKGAPQGTIVGQSGLEREYDRYLRGQDGVERFLVDAQGNPRGRSRAKPPVAGHEVKLSLDLGLQEAGQEALARSGQGRPGAFVAMDPRNGDLLAMGSYPSFDPNVFSKPLTQAKYEAIFSEDAGAPNFNRAVLGGYPTGSTFKPITALAALKAGIITPSTTIASPACVTIASREFCNAGHANLGSPDLATALKVSSDVFFYTLGARANGLPGQVIQSMAHKLGLGHTTGVDLPSEYGGLLPDRAWRARVAKKEEDYEKRTHKPCCTFSDKRPWTIGDNVNLAVGQGDLQATPLQMAVAYAAIENGGKVVRPQLAKMVADEQGRPIQEIDRGNVRRVKLDPGALAAVRLGLHEATSQEGGTSYGVFKDWPQDRFPVYGKTGTAERPPHPDQSWFVAYVPDPKRPIVVAVTIENAGFGADFAAPAARLILSKWYGVKGKLVTSRVIAG